MSRLGNARPVSTKLRWRVEIRASQARSSWLSRRRWRHSRSRAPTGRADMEHPVVEIGSGDLHVIGEAEAPLERAPGDAAVQVTVAVLSLLFLLRLARHQKGVLLNGDIDFGRGEPSHGHGKPIGMFTGLLDVVRRVAKGGAVNAGRRIKQAS
jgi:hypothetical protein